MDIEESIEHLELFIEDLKELDANEDFLLQDGMKFDTLKAIETLLTAYEEKSKELEKVLNEEAEVRISVSADNQIRQLQKELEKEKEKNNKIDEFCRKELAFERRLKRENREPDKFNQGRFYVSEEIRKIIKEE